MPYDHQKWTVRFISKTARREMEDQPESIQARFLQVTFMIESEGLDKLPWHYKKLLRDGIWEMRLRGRDTFVRALYLKAVGRRVMILHVFAKKSRKTPRGKIELALKRAKEVGND